MTTRLFILALEENDGRVRRVEKRFPWDSFKSMKPDVAGSGMLHIMGQLETEMGNPKSENRNSPPQSPANPGPATATTRPIAVPVAETTTISPPKPRGRPPGKKPAEPSV
jgi:hypothetical protein